MPAPMSLPLNKSHFEYTGAQVVGVTITGLCKKEGAHKNVFVERDREQKEKQRRETRYAHLEEISRLYRGSTLLGHARRHTSRAHCRSSRSAVRSAALLLSWSAGPGEGCV